MRTAKRRRDDADRARFASCNHDKRELGAYRRDDCRGALLQQ